MRGPLIAELDALRLSELVVWNERLPDYSSAGAPRWCWALSIVLEAVPLDAGESCGHGRNADERLDLSTAHVVACARSVLREAHSMRVRPFFARFRWSRCSHGFAVVAASAVANLALSSPCRAAAPGGWSLESHLDGGTSSLGSSIAATDNVAAVGAPFATPGTGTGGKPTGAVFVYSGAGGGWTSQKVTAPAPIDGGNFGTSVAASGDLLAVGAAGTPPAAYVFVADAGTYENAQTWADPKGDTNGSFGGSVAVLQGDDGTSYVAVAAPPGSASATGVVYVSRQVSGGAWSSPLTALSDPSAQTFGIAIAFAANGDLLVGDPGTGDGQVLVYSPEADGGWASEGTLAFSLDGGAVQQFGNGVATWNDVAVVTAPGTSNGAATYNGVAFVFQANDAGVWQQQAVLMGGPTESFGGFLPAVNGALIAVGSAINTASSGAGQVDVWAYSGDAWVPVPSASLVGDSYYGQAVGLVGSTLFVGDTSALGASSISAVTSSLFIETAVYADAGAYDDATVGANDAALEGDGSAQTLDGSAPPAGDASTGSNGEAGAGGGTASSSSGCSCALAGEDAPGGLLALLGESALVVLAWARRRKGSRRAGGNVGRDGASKLARG